MIIWIVLIGLAQLSQASSDPINSKLDEIVNRIGIIGSKNDFMSPDEKNELWETFKSHYSKSYDEENKVRENFEGHVNSAIIHNRLYNAKQRYHRLGIHEYSDMSAEKFSAQMNGYKMGKKTPRGLHQIDPTKNPAPLGVDWRLRNAVTPVKNQGSCGSCYSFSATGALEGLLVVNNKPLRNLSEQQILDCSGHWGNHGCNGGWMDSCFQYVADNKGIDTEENYEYMSFEGYCSFNRDDVAATCTNFVEIPRNNEHALMDAVYRAGPVSVAINANSEFMSYRDGVLVSTDCPDSGLNHGVLLVGYGVEEINGERVKYWLVKNSWGTSWGDKGYIKMARMMPGNENMCGIAAAASYPIM